MIRKNHATRLVTRNRWKRLRKRSLQAITLSGLVVAGTVFTAGQTRVPQIAATDAILVSPAVVVATKPKIADIVEMILAAPAKPFERGPFRSIRGGEQAFRVSQILRNYTRDPAKADRIASAIVAEGTKHRISPSLLVGVLLTENPWLDPNARSKVGARGLMQVMPFHSGKWGCGSRDLFDIEANICHGVRILEQNLKDEHNLNGALLAYNGCVRGTNTPNCFTYSRHVLKYADMSARVINGTTVSGFTQAPPHPSPMRKSFQRIREWKITIPSELLVDD
ncbi:MAG: lytic transglycosylase domain-containing protein [Gemmatimonadaceae bacterium]|nr:lytic transglycosylase domain-containing protein [Gemmatimonadaceae bacterium]